MKTAYHYDAAGNITGSYKIREGGRMEIRIEYHKTFNTCDCADEEERRCAMPGRLWQTVCGGMLFVACKKHGLPLMTMLKVAAEYRKGGVTITGGYDEPKSNLVQTRHKFLHEREGLADSLMAHHAIVDIFDYLIEKERADAN